MKIRNAVPEDAPSFVEIASSVRMRDPADAAQQERGFLIDISLEQYRYFIAHDHALVMGEGNAGPPIGFSVILGPATMAASGIRAKAERIEGIGARLRELDPESCAYWEQLAFLPRYARGIYPAYLGFESLRRALLRYEHLFGAVASRPLRNMAPLRLLQRAGWERVGWIDEDNPRHGRVRYDIYDLGRSGFQRSVREPEIGALEQRLRTRGIIDTQLPSGGTGGMGGGR